MTFRGERSYIIENIERSQYARMKTQLIIASDDVPFCNPQIIVVDEFHHFDRPLQKAPTTSPATASLTTSLSHPNILCRYLHLTFPLEHLKWSAYQRGNPSTNLPQHMPLINLRRNSLASPRSHQAERLPRLP